jgi:hypothetical protein
MKNKNIMMIIMGMIFLVVTMQLISGEIYLWNEIKVDNTTQIVNYHAYYQFLDTSASDIGSGTYTALTLKYHIEPLPLNLTPDGATLGEVDWCNFTITHIKNIYGTTFVAFEGFSGGQLLNTTVETQNIYFSTNASVDEGLIVILLKDKDSVTADMRCHYTTSDGLYWKNILAGRFDTFMSSFECSQCKDYSLEQLSNMAQRNENITANQVSVYYNIQKVVDFNWQIWLIVSWILKIGFIFIGVGLIFAGVYYFYVFFSNIGRELSR